MEINASSTVWQGDLSTLSSVHCVCLSYWMRKSSWNPLRISARYLLFPRVLPPLISAAFCFKRMMVKEFTACEENNSKKLSLISEEWKKNYTFLVFSEAQWKNIMMFISQKKFHSFLLLDDISYFRFGRAQKQLVWAHTCSNRGVRTDTEICIFTKHIYIFYSKYL